MKNKTPFSILFFFLLLCSQCLYSATVCSYFTYSAFQEKEQLQQPKTGAAKKGKDAAKKAGAEAAKAKEDSKKLVQKILGFFRFRYNRDKRIERIIDSTGLKDSIANTKQQIADLAGLVAKLSDTTYQNTDSLIKLIGALSQRNSDIIIDLKKRDSIVKLMDSIARLPRLPVTGANDPPTDLEKLATQIQSIAEKEKNAADEKNKITTVSNFRNIMATEEKIYIHRKSTGNKNEKLVTSYKLKVSPLARVAFFYALGSNTYIPPKHQLDFVSNIVVNNAFFANAAGLITGNIPVIEKDVLLKDISLRNANKFIFSVALKPVKPGVDNFLLKKSIGTNPAFIEQVKSILAEKNAFSFSGINLDITQLNTTSLKSQDSKNLRNNLTLLINKLAAYLSAQPNQKALFVTLPPMPDYNLLDLNEVDNYASFIIDFTKTSQFFAGPSDPLKGITETEISIELGYGTYANNYNVSPGRYLLALPYKGAFWELMPGSKPDTVIAYFPYDSIIRILRKETSLSDPIFNNAYINITNSKKRTVWQIWYNNAATLGEKYDFINNNKIGGVAIDALGDDSTRPELWDMLFYKFGKIDTLNKQTDSLVIDSLVPATLWEKIKYRAKLYAYVLQNPCAVCFENIADSATRAEISILIQKLGIDETVYKSRIIANQEDSNIKHAYPLGGYANTFEIIQEELTFFFRIASLVFTVAFLILLAIGFWKVKTIGDKWPYKRGILISLIALLFILFITILGYFFVNNKMPFFGSYSVAQKKRDEFQLKVKAEARIKMPLNDSIRIYKDSILQLRNKIDSSGIFQNKDTTLVKKISAKEELRKQIENSCTPDKDIYGECINMPFYSLILIAFGGITLGYLVTRFMFIPFMTKETPVSKTK